MRHIFQNRTNKLLASGALCALFLGAIIAGCGGGSGNSPLNGNGGSGGNSGTSIGNFTVSPARAAPGAIVTLQGANLGANDDITIKFGGEEAIIRARGANAKVYVPLSLDAANRAVTPAAPVAVTIAVGSGAPKAATAPFTITPLPAAPGAARALAGQMTDLAGTLDNLSTNLLAPLAQSGGFDRRTAAQAQAMANQAKFLAGGAGNPNSVAAILAGTAPVWGGKPLPQGLVDSMLAQAEAGREMEKFGAGLVAIIREVAPEALQNSGTQARLVSGSQPIYSPPEGNESSLRSLSNAKYKILPNAKKVILMLKFQRYLANYGEGLGDADLLFNDTTEKFVEILGTIADKVKGGVVGVGARAIITLYTSAQLSGKFALGFAGLIPDGVSEFYVRLGGTKCGDGDPPYVLKNGQTVALDSYVVTSRSGRKIVGADDVKAAFKALLLKTRLKKFFEDNKVSEKNQDEIIDSLFKLTTLSIRAGYRNQTGEEAPFIDADGNLKALPGKNPELKLNDPEANVERLNVVLYSTASTRILQISNDAPVAPNSVRVKAIDVGCNAGFVAKVVYTPLATLISESPQGANGTKPLTQVRTSINVPDASGNCPVPTATPRPNANTCAGGATFEFNPNTPCGRAGGVIDCQTGECLPPK